MAENPKEPGDFVGPVTTRHVGTLLAAISKIETLDALHAPTQRDDTRPGARFPPIPHVDRIKKILDAFATLCVSQSKHEVVAIAVRHDRTRRNLTFMMAANAAVSRDTHNHFKSMWAVMQKITQRYDQLHPNTQGISPTGPIRDPEIHSLDKQLARLCLRFSWPRLQSRLNGEFGQFSVLVDNCTGLPPEHPFARVAEVIMKIEALFTREVGARIGKPAIDHDWQLLYAALVEAKKRIRILFRDPQALEDVDPARLLYFTEYERYLRKFMSIFDSIEILYWATVSSKTRGLLYCTITVLDLPGQQIRLDNVPTTSKDWERVLQDALAYDNSLREGGGRGALGLDMDVVREDTHRISQQTISKDIFAHPEAKLLAKIEQEQAESPDMPKAFTYIGLSELSCHGCDCFIRALNSVHGTSWATRGSDGKAYFPWKFPLGAPKEDEVCKKTYDILASGWVKSYSGYRQQHPLDPDFEAQLSTFRGDARERYHELIEQFNSL